MTHLECQKLYSLFCKENNLLHLLLEIIHIYRKTLTTNIHIQEYYRAPRPNSNCQISKFMKQKHLYTKNIS